MISTTGSTFYGGGNTVTADRGNHWIEYDYKKGDCSLIKKPDVSQFMKFSSNDDVNKELSQFIMPVLYTAKLDTNLYAGYLHNIDGRNPYKMLYYNKSGEIVRRIPNYLIFEDNPDNIAQYTPSFYLYRGANYFKELFSDTVFVVNKSGITPAFVLNAGPCSAPYEKQDVLNDFSAYKLVKLIGESDQHLFLFYDYAGKKYVGVMNKETRNVKVSVDGITDDLNYSFSLTPQYICGKEMLCVLPAMLISEWVESNKNINLSFPENLKSIQEDANPVIAIVTLK